MARTEWIGETLNERYQIQELLGKGGMSAVYKANDPNLRRVVAVKLIHQHLSDDPEFVRRFEEEAAAVAQLRHPNLIQVFDFNNDDGTYFIVFEFVPGETVQDRIKRVKMANRQMPIDEVIEIVAKSAEGLDYAHKKGLIHRDIKPANIMISVTGIPIIMDFGIAKIMGGTQHTATGAVLGTARYMSPEQIKGENIDPRTDFYSLGVTLYEMLGGRPPFEADSAMTLMMMHMTDPVPDLNKIRSDVPPALAAVVSKSLAKDRNDRFASGQEFADALRDAAKPGAAAIPVAATVVDSGPVTPDPEATIIDSDPDHATAAKAAVAGVTAAAALTNSGSPTAAPTAAPATPAAAASAPPPAKSSGGSRGLLYGAGGVILLLVLAIGVWAIFFRDTGGGEEPVPGAVVEVPTATLEPTDEPPDEAATAAAFDAIVEERLAVSAAQTAEAQADIPTDIPEPTDTPTAEPTEVPDVDAPIIETDATTDWVRGEVYILSEAGNLVPFTADTPIIEGTEFTTGADGEVLFTLDDSSTVQLAPNSNMRLEEVADDPINFTEQTLFTLTDGDIFLQKPKAGNELVVIDPDEYILATLQISSLSSIDNRASMGKRLLQASSSASMAVGLDKWVTVSCFSGTCTTGSNESSLQPGFEKVSTPEGGFINSYQITTATESYNNWQTACEGCLAQVPMPVQSTNTPVPPTNTPVPLTATTAATATTVIYTPTPTTVATEEAGGDDLFVQITGISLDNGTYVISYVTSGYTPGPAEHVHFYFDTVPESQAGLPGGGPWKLYRGPSPFRGYGEGNRPGGASSMCARVAYADHSIISGSGNCYPLP